MSNVFKTANGFYEYLVEEEIASSNPFRKVTKKGQYSSSQLESSTSWALTPLQWDYVIDTAEFIAAADPRNHERTLYVPVTMFSMYLRISDILGRTNWQPTMGDFRLDADNMASTHFQSFVAISGALIEGTTDIRKLTRIR